MVADDRIDGRVAVIVCSRNRPVMLVGAVASVLAGDKLPVELIIVDQSDPDRPQPDFPAVPAGCRLNHHRTTSVGASRARNLGASIATCEWLVFADDDVVVEPDWLRELTDALSRADADCIVTGRVVASMRDGAAGYAPSTVESCEPLIWRGVQSHDPLLSGNMAIAAELYRRIGGFDERLGPGTRLGSSEDNDLGHRLLKAGYAIEYVPSATMTHLAWRATRHYFVNRWGYGTGRGAFYCKHLSFRDGHMRGRFYRDVRDHLLALPHLLLRREFRQVAGHLVLTAGILSGALVWAACYRVIPSRIVMRR